MLSSPTGVTSQLGRHHCPARTASTATTAGAQDQHDDHDRRRAWHGDRAERVLFDPERHHRHRHRHHGDRAREAAEQGQGAVDEQLQRQVQAGTFRQRDVEQREQPGDRGEAEELPAPHRGYCW